MPSRTAVPPAGAAPGLAAVANGALGPVIQLRWAGDRHLLALYQQGYEVGRFISIEKLIEQSKETYYDALGHSTAGWHET